MVLIETLKCPSLAVSSVEVVERKGLGRPDTICAERLRYEPRPFIGRDAELALLRVAYRRQSGRSVFAVVYGPPGQGKTRLVEEFLG
jgi:hypothetical protein